MTQLSIGRPRFLTTPEILTLQETSINQYGGAHGLRDPGLLDSAIAQPQQAFSGEFVHTYPFEMAAAYTFHLCQNHPFVDGNKRVAFYSTVTFLRMNGWNLQAPQDDATETMLKIAKGEMQKNEIAAWLQSNSRERPRMELRDFFAQLSAEDIGERYKSFKSGGVKTNLEPGFTEVAEAWPVARTILDVMLKCDESGQDLDESQLSNLLLLTALYRIAENMGYEW